MILNVLISFFMGDLITQEFTDKGQLRLNLLALETDNARLLHSRELSCEGYSPVKWTDEIVYVNCNGGAEPSTQLLKLNPIEGFTEIGRWTLTGYQELRAVSSEVVLMYSWNNLMRADQNGCNIYQLLPEKEPVLLKHLESCPYMKVELTPTQAWMAEGFAGIKEIKW
ncbi:MAG: hypothetical protein ABFS56_05915 [Pseudomonadota bacterium]